MKVNVLEKILYHVCRPVSPYSDTVASHIGVRKVRFLERFDLFSIPSCTIWPAYSVAYRGGYLARETVKWPDRTFQINVNLRKYPVVKIGGVVTTIGDQWADNFYHKYVDCIPRLMGLQYVEKLRSVTLLLDDRFNEEDLLLMRALVPSSVKMKIISKYRRVKCDRYIFLPRLSVPVEVFPKNFSQLGALPEEYIAFYRRCLSETFGVEFGRANPAKKIYITRTKARKRRMLNEDEVVGKLHSLGFVTVALEDLPLLDQVRLFADASVVAGVHGAGFTNLLYVPGGTKVLEIFPSQNSVTPHFSSAKELLRLNYARAYMRPVDKRAGKDGDGHLNLTELERALQSLDVQ